MQDQEESSSECLSKRAHIELSKIVSKAMVLLTSPSKQKVTSILKRKKVEPSVSVQFKSSVLLPRKSMARDSTPNTCTKRKMPTIFTSFKEVAKASELRGKKEAKDVSEKMAPFRLLSALDYDKGVMRLSLLESPKK